MAALSWRKKKICALALIVILDKVENEDTEIFYFWREISVETNCSRIGMNFRQMFIQIYFTS